jgi:hypothetical protein
MTIDELLAAFMEGGITLGMLALFGFMIIRLPALMREAVSTAISPLNETNKAHMESVKEAHKAQTEALKELRAELRLSMYTHDGNAAGRLSSLPDREEA